VVDALFPTVADTPPLTIVDARPGRRSIARFEGDRLVFALWLAPDPVLVSRQWAVSLLSESHPPQTRASVLAGRPGTDRPDPGAIVCACNGVGINTILDAVTSGGCHTVDAVGVATLAGTNCGSCRAEIAQLVDARLATAG